MTLTQIANQVYSLSVGGYFNHEKFTKSQFISALKAWMKTGKRYILEIALPDGWWYMSVNQYGDALDSYDYYIPETIEQSHKLLNSLISP